MLHKNGARGREGKTSPVHTQAAASARHSPRGGGNAGCSAQSPAQMWSPGAGGSFPARLRSAPLSAGIPGPVTSSEARGWGPDAAKQPGAGALSKVLPLLERPCPSLAGPQDSSRFPPLKMALITPLSGYKDGKQYIHDIGHYQFQQMAGDFKDREEF